MTSPATTRGRSKGAKTSTSPYSNLPELEKLQSSLQENLQRLIDPDGTVHLVISRDAKTLLLYRWHRTAGWAHISRTAQGRSVES